MNRIFVVCTGNTCRSPMAEGIIRKIVEEERIEGVSVKSAGLAAYYGDPPSDYAVEALREIGIDISGHRSRPVTREELAEADVIYVMTQQHKNVILDAMPEVKARIAVMEIADPFGLSLEHYQACRDEMLTYFRQELTGGKA